MYHTIVDITGENVKTGDIAYLDVNPLYITKDIKRKYKSKFDERE